MLRFKPATPTHTKTIFTPRKKNKKLKDGLYSKHTARQERRNKNTAPSISLSTLEDIN